MKSGNVASGILPDGEPGPLGRRKGYSIANWANLWFITDVSNKEMVIGLLSKLPEDTSLEEIAREIELLAGIKTARDQAHRNEGIPAEDARKLIDAWVAR